MRFYFEGELIPKKSERQLAKISLTPATNSRSGREIFVLIAEEVGTPKSGNAYNFALIGRNETPMIFPNSKPASKIMVMASIPQPAHRSDGYLDISKSTGSLISESRGGGAWGSGSVFLAILNEGERMVSNRLTVWENIKGELIKINFNSLAEYEFSYGSPEIQIL